MLFIFYRIFNHNVNTGKMNEFKEKIFEIIIDEVNQELNFDRLAYNVQSWPEVSYYNEDDNNMEYQTLGADNCSIIIIQDDYMEIVAGGDYQRPHLVRIELGEGELTATYFEPSEFLTGMDYEEIVELLQS